MIVGVPKEIKQFEARVALVPAGAEALRRRGHTVLVQAGAGEGTGAGPGSGVGSGTGSGFELITTGGSGSGTGAGAQYLAGHVEIVRN